MRTSPCDRLCGTIHLRSSLALHRPLSSFLPLTTFVVPAGKVCKDHPHTRYSMLLLTYASDLRNPANSAHPVSTPTASSLSSPPRSPLRRSQSKLRFIGWRTQPLPSTGRPLRPIPSSSPSKCVQRHQNSHNYY